MEIVPPLPGSVIRHQVLNRLKVKQASLARAMGVSPARVNQILKGHAPISASVALRLGKVTSTDPVYWLELQTKYDLHRASLDLRDTLENLVPLPDVQQTQ